ncbi:unnamed protein product [Rotaria sp. Silwood2]|nr:unnamed protein product [Rotaria sp. Silwood2]CAF2902241.1 unnamed protein product [Rotaria sp. Silwood2]CAF3230445.1 unnamed protein product [Rotaria sp. Silwood2]CAF4100845.1 unnamed protein product [Rotaria sp. Silwood2]
MSALTFVVPDIVLVILCRRLVNYVHQISSRVNGNHQLRMYRDLTMIRRIVLLNFQFVLLGIPAIIFMLMNIIRPNLLPHYCMRVLIIIGNVTLDFLLIVLCQNTPSLQRSIADCFNLAPGFLINNANRIRPNTEAQRF